MLTQGRWNVNGEGGEGEGEREGEGEGEERMERQRLTGKPGVVLLAPGPGG